MGDILKNCCIRVNGKYHHIRPIERKLNLGGRSYSIGQILYRKGGLIIGEGDTGKSTYVSMLKEAASANNPSPILIRLRNRPALTIPDVPDGRIQTIIWDGLDEYPDCAREIADLTSNLDPDRYHVWVTSRPGAAASIIARSPILEDVYHLEPFTEADVLNIANSVNLDGQRFLAAVRGTHFASFMSKPGGAVILMQLFANGKLSGNSRTDLMELVMCDFARETRDGDDAVTAKHNYTESEIVDATCWIATCLTLTGRDAIWTGTESQCPANDIALGRLPPRDYSIDLFRAALGLRLFEPLTSERYRLAYSDMPSFLAGRWIASNLSLKDLRALIPEKVNYFTSAHAEVVSWASCFSPPLGRPWIMILPECFLACHTLIDDVGCGCFFEALVKRYRESDCANCPHDFFKSKACDISNFDEFVKFLQTVVRSSKSSDEEFTLAVYLLQEGGAGREDVAETLIDRLRNRSNLTDMNTFRLTRALYKVCNGRRHDSLSSLADLVNIPGNDLISDNIRRYVGALLRGNTLQESAVTFTSAPTARPRPVLTERAVEQLLETFDPISLSYGAKPAPPEDEEELRPGLQALLDEIYPTAMSTKGMTEEEIDAWEKQHPDGVILDEEELAAYEEDRAVFREELLYDDTYNEDKDQEETDEIMPDEPQADYMTQQLTSPPMLIDRIIEAQEQRGLNYCALDRFFKELFVEKASDIFVYPKIFVDALAHEPVTYLPMLTKAVESNATTGRAYLSILEKTPHAHVLKDALRANDVFQAIEIYRHVLCGGRLFNGSFLNAAISRICKEPTVEVEDALCGISCPVETEAPTDPFEIDNISNCNELNEIEPDDSHNYSTDFDHVHNRVLQLVRSRRERLNGKVDVTLNDLTNLGMKARPDPATSDDVHRAFENKTHKIVTKIVSKIDQSSEDLKTHITSEANRGIAAKTPTLAKPKKSKNSPAVCSRFAGESWFNIAIKSTGRELVIGVKPKEVSLEFSGEHQWRIIDALFDAWKKGFGLAEVGKQNEIKKIFGSEHGKHLLKYIHFQTRKEAGLASKQGNYQFTGCACFRRELIYPEKFHLKKE